jgi:short-subunit dehydrogenase
VSQGKVVFISGASSGIGAATATAFAAQNFKVVLAARRQDKLQALADQIRAGGGEALPLQTDVTRLESIQGAVAQTLDHWGHVDVLFNNAGFGKFNWLEKLDPRREVENQLRVNLLGTIWMAQAVLPNMIERRSGHIINMASVSGLIGTPTYSIYAASKFGIRGFTQALRREVKVWGIHVSAVFPGGVETAFADKSGSTKRKTGISTPRWLKLSPQDVAEAIVRLSERPKSIVVLPWLMRYSVWANNMVPSLVDWVSTERFVKPERGLD